jgi:hypothetical protein
LVPLSKGELILDGVHAAVAIVPPVIAWWANASLIEAIVLGLVLLNISILVRWRSESIPRETLRTIYNLDTARKRAFYLQSKARHSVRTTLGNWKLDPDTRKYILNALKRTSPAHTYRTFDRSKYPRDELITHMGETWNQIRHAGTYHLFFGNVGHTGALLIDDGKRANIRSSASLYLSRANAWICLYHEGRTKSFTDFVKDLIEDVESSATPFDPSTFDVDFKSAEPQIRIWLQSQNIGF